MFNLDKLVGRVVGDVFHKDVRQSAQQAFDVTKKHVIERVVNHKVSQELRNRTQPSSILKHRGDLFSFMGFDDGSDPVGDLLKLLESKMTFKVQNKNGLARFLLQKEVILVLPDKEDMRDAGMAIARYDSRSWPESVEDGVDGLSYFLSKRDWGVSKGGIQLKTMIGGGTFEGTKFLTPIFESAKKVFLQEMRKNKKTYRVIVES